MGEAVIRPWASPYRTAAIALLTVAAGGGFWYALDRPASGIDTRQIALGKTIYADRCASCHGAHLEGQPHWAQRLPNGRLPAPPHDASGHTFHHSDEQLFEITKNGPSAIVPGYESDMPGFKDILSDQEIRAVLAYIKSTWPERIRAAQQRANEPLR